MRLALYGSAALVLVNATLIACSSAAPPADSGEKSDDQTAAPTDTFQAPATPAPATPAPATDPDGGGVVVTDPNAIPTTPVPTTSDPGLACLPDSIKETEGNNDATTANTIPTASATFCGRLEAGDVDHVKFIMPQTMRRFSYRPEVGFGTVMVEATAGGVPFDVNGSWPFAGGQPYVFKLSSPGNQRPVDYRLRFEFTP